MINKQLFARSARLKWFEVDPNVLEFTLKTSLIETADVQFPEVAPINGKIYYTMAKTKVFNQGKNILFTIPIGGSNSPLYKDLIVLVFSKDWILKDAFQLEGPSQFYSVRENSKHGILIAFANQLYQYKFE